MKKILIMREAKRSTALSQYLQQQNFEIFIEPLFSVVKVLSENYSQLNRHQKINSIIITSQNAIEGLKNFSDDWDIKIYAVGKKTAQRLSEEGYKNILYPKKSGVKELIKLIKKDNEVKSQSMLYFRGEVISFDLKNYLQEFGYNVIEEIAYKTISKGSFSKKLIKNIDNFYFSSVLIFSQKSLEIFFLLAQKHNLLEYFAQSSLIVFSQNIVDKAHELARENLKFKKIEKFSDNIILKNFYE